MLTINARLLDLIQCDLGDTFSVINFGSGQQQQPSWSCYQLNNSADATGGRRSANWVLNN